MRDIFPNHYLIQNKSIEKLFNSYVSYTNLIGIKASNFRFHMIFYVKFQISVTGECILFLIGHRKNLLIDPRRLETISHFKQ
jgi:hypothetical protein